MKKILLSFLGASALFAQSGSVTTVLVDNASSLPNGLTANGPCTTYNVQYQALDTRHIYACRNPNPQITSVGTLVDITSTGGGQATASWGSVTGTITAQSDLAAALTAKQNAISQQTCPAGQHFASFAVNGSFGCTTDTGGGATLPITSALLKGNNAGSATAAVAGDVTSLFSGSGTYLKADGTKGTPTGGSSLPTTTALLKGDNAGSATSATVTDVTGLFSGAGTYLRKDGTTGTPSGTGTTLPSTTNILKGDNTGGAAAASSTDVVGLFSGTSGALCSDGSRGNCGITATASATSVANAAARPTIAGGTTGLIIQQDRNPGDKLLYWDGSAWFAPGAYGSSLTRDASTGVLDINPNNVPLLNATNTFGNYLQTIPSAKITTCVQGDGTTPCWGVGSNAVPTQNNGVSLGNMSTLNFGAGVGGSISSGTVTLANTGVTQLNGQTGNVSLLPDLAEDASWTLTLTSHNTVTAFILNNTNAASGGVHNFGFFAATDGSVNSYDYTANRYIMHNNGDASYGPTAVAFAALAACGTGNKGALAEVTDSSTNVWGATVTGGGANEVGAHCNGTNWTVYAK